MLFRLSLYRQILLLVSMVLATSVASYGWLVSKRQAQVYDLLFSQVLEVSARNIAELCAHHLAIEDYAAMEHYLLRTADLPDIKRLRVCEPNGRLLVDIVRRQGGRPEARYNAPPLTPPSLAEPRHTFDPQESARVVWYPIKAGRLLGWLQLTVGMSAVTALDQTVWKSTALLAVIWISAGVILLILVLRPPLITIRRLADFARMLNSRKGEEVTVHSTVQEVSELATALNLASRELHTSEANLLDERERLSVIISSIGDGVIACDRDGRILLMNQAAERLTACTHPTGRPLVEVLPLANGSGGATSALLDQALAAPRTSPPAALQTTFALPSGESRTVACVVTPLLSAQGEPVGTVTVLRDETDKVRMTEEKQQLELQLRQAQKMEAIGTLAGGIAHDFNNILTAISGYAELTQLDLDETSRAGQNLREVLTACGRAKELVRQILAFSRKSDQERMPIQIHLIVKEALKLLRSSIPTTIEFRQEINASCGSVLTNPTEIHQIMMNLCVNAFHAMRDRGQGVMTVSLTPVQLGPEDVARMGLEVAPGAYVCLSVGDTGHGMDQTVMEKIFDPYFTTKKMGEGTGMGLAVVHGIVKRSGGHIMVHSEPGEGTTFKVYLPQFQANGSSLHPLEPASILPIPGGNERILLVDDDVSIIGLCTDLLGGLGYRVDSTTSSREALERFQGAPAAFDLVITDMTMPEMTGAELAKALLAIRPDLPIILCSGYSEALVNLKASDSGIRAYLQKPFPRRTLAVTVRTTLDAQQLGR